MKYKIKLHLKRAGMLYIIFIPMLSAIISAELVSANLEEHNGFYVLGAAAVGAVLSWYVVMKILIWFQRVK